MSALDTLLAGAQAHHNGGRLEAAEAAYRAAFAQAPSRAAIGHNLAVVVAALGRQEEALALLDAVVAAEPGYASAHYNRGVVFQALGRAREALTSLTRCAALDPGHYEAHRALGFLWFAQGQRGRALDHFARTCELRRGEDRAGAAWASLTHASSGKLSHDAAQLAYIARTKRDGKRFELLARAYLEVARDFPETISPLSERQLDMLGDDYNTAIHIASAPEVEGPAVSPIPEHARIASQANTGATWIDHLLTPTALASLRRYLLESTVWHDFSHIGGFVASYLEDGLACPLVMQIADELRAALPDMLGEHPLTQAWAFKGLDGAASVAAHADDAAYTVNLWVTPDAANLDPARGGLSICRVPPPPDWRIRGYEADTAEIDAFMERHRAQSTDVPYGENRAVLFPSGLFHRSDAPRFAPGYENHRINFTLLYG